MHITAKYCRRTILPVLALLLMTCSPELNEQVSRPSQGFNEGYEPLIDSVINLMTLDEKIHMIHGDGTFVSGGVERLGIPELIYSDGPTGIREELERESWQPLNLPVDSVTFFPTGTALAATWNEDLAVEFGRALGSEANARGKHILLGPGVNLIRTPLCGRNFEYFSEDPWLNSRIAVGYIRGVQQMDVAAAIKHYALNNQEHERGQISVELDERALREIYLPVYKAAAIEAQCLSFMAAYNKFRGEWMSENDYLLNQVLKKEWGYKGAVMFDWGGTHSAVDAALAGLDIEMGGQLDNMYFAGLADSVKAGLVPESVVDDKVRRILRIVYNTKIKDPDRVSGSVSSDSNRQTAYQVASESVVLLKNSDDLLPLNLGDIGSVAVIGDNATRIQSRGGRTAGVKAKYEITPLEGIHDRFGDEIDVFYAKGYEHIMIEQENGGHHPISRPLQEPNPELIQEAVDLARKTDVAIIIGGTSRSVESEGFDRENIKLPFGQDELIRAVCKANKNTVVVIVAGAACDLEVARKEAPAVLYAWFNGSEAGNALADILAGEVNPSGKLPFTIPKELNDMGPHALSAYPGENKTVTYQEGILVGYRWFDTRKISPAYCFGHGLSYTEFVYSNLEAESKEIEAGETLDFSVVVENVGYYDGSETVQVYVRHLNSSVDRAEKELKAFRKVPLNIGEAQEVEFSLDTRDLAYYDPETASWIIEPGKYKLMVGASSQDIREELEFSVR